MASSSSASISRDAHNQSQNTSCLSNGNGLNIHEFLSMREEEQLEKENAQLKDIAMKYKQELETLKSREASLREELTMREEEQLEKQNAQLKDIAMKYKQELKTLKSMEASLKEELNAIKNAEKDEQMIKALQSSIASSEEELFMLHQSLKAEREKGQRLKKELGV